MNVTLTDDVRTAYEKLFTGCTIKPEHLGEVTKDVTNICNNKGRYEAVASKLNIPWYFVGLIHCMEASLNFKTHLHNGDPLTARTVHVPAGRPQTGNPPFTWEESAIDALTLRGLNKVTDWSLPSILYHLEGYNGFGYRGEDPPINTPYLWSYSNNYTSGKFVADGKYDPDAVSKECGAAVLLRQMVTENVVSLNATDKPLANASANGSQVSATS